MLLWAEDFYFIILLTKVNSSHFELSLQSPVYGFFNLFTEMYC